MMGKAWPYLTTGAPQVEIMSTAIFLFYLFETRTLVWIKILAKKYIFLWKMASKDIQKYQMSKNIFDAILFL